MASRAWRAVIAVVSAEATSSPVRAGASVGSQNIDADDVADALYAAAKTTSRSRPSSSANPRPAAPTRRRRDLAAVRAAKAVKPVVISMALWRLGRLLDRLGGVGHRRRADTLTGSIGVFGGKIVFGAGPGQVRRRHARPERRRPIRQCRQPTAEFTPQQRAAFAASVDRVYAGFIQRVADGRHLTPDRVREIARAGSGPAPRPGPRPDR